MNNVIKLYFTGREIRGFNRSIETTCDVRTFDNGRRVTKGSVLRELDGRVHTDGVGTPYMPDRFPPGEWMITEVRWDVRNIYEPCALITNAHQKLAYWLLDKKGNYWTPSGKFFDGWGYWIHHARLWSGGRLVDSATTLGCLNTLDMDDMTWLGGEVSNAMELGKVVSLKVPEREEWRT